MKNKKKVLLAGVLLCLASGVSAVDVVDGKIKGVVIDGELGGPLEFVQYKLRRKVLIRYYKELLPEMMELLVLQV